MAQSGRWFSRVFLGLGCHLTIRAASRNVQLHHVWFVIDEHVTISYMILYIYTYLYYIYNIYYTIYISMCMYIEFSFASKKWRHELGETFDWWWSECVILMQVFHIFREVLVHTAQSNRCKSSHKPIFCNTCFVFVLESEGTPSSLPYFHRINRIFHEINHPAIGVPPLMDIPAWVWGF